MKNSSVIILRSGQKLVGSEVRAVGGKTRQLGAVPPARRTRCAPRQASRARTQARVSTAERGRGRPRPVAGAAGRQEPRHDNHHEFILGDLPKDLADALMGFDVDGDGFVTLAELAEGARLLHRTQEKVCATPPRGPDRLPGSLAWTTRPLVRCLACREVGTTARWCLGGCPPRRVPRSCTFAAFDTPLPPLRPRRSCASSWG